MNAPTPPKVIRKFWESRFGQLLVRLLEPSKWWTIAFAVGAIGILVWTLTIYRAQAKDEATHAAEIVANADGQFNQCRASIPVLTKINAFIAGERIIRNTLVENSYKVYAATPVGAERVIRRANWLRLRRARAEAYQVKFPVPTIHPKKNQPNGSSCDELRSRLLASQ